MDALSLPCNSVNSAPKLLLHTTFDGMALNTAGTYAADSASPSKNWYTPYSDSSDSTTGYDLVATLRALWGSNTSVVLQSIPQNSILLADFGTYFSPNLSGGELTLQCNLRDSSGAGTANPQQHFVAIRTAAQALSNDINEIYIESEIKLPAGLDLQTGNTATGKYFVVTEVKTGGYNSVGSYGDMRFKLQLNGIHGINEWSCVVDDQANGQGIVPGIPSPASPDIYYVNYSGVAATLDTWTKIFIWWKRDAGRLVMAVQPVGGVFTIVGNVTSSDMLASNLAKATLYGLENLPITRFFMHSNYTSHNLPINLNIRDFQLWDKPRINLA